MTYSCGEDIQLFDHVEVSTGDGLADMGIVQSIGNGKHKGQLYVRWDSEYIKPRRQWVAISDCIMIAREA